MPPGPGPGRNRDRCCHLITTRSRPGPAGRLTRRAALAAMTGRPWPCLVGTGLAGGRALGRASEEVAGPRPPARSDSESGSGPGPGSGRAGDCCASDIIPGLASHGPGRGIIPLGPPTGFTVRGKFSSLFNFYVAQARVFTVTLVSVTGIYRDFGSGHGWGIYRDFGAVL